MKSASISGVKSEKRSRRQKWLLVSLLLLICALTLLVFQGSLRSDFIYSWDDNINVTNNPHIKNLSWQGLTKLFDPESPIDEPRLTLATYALEYHYFSLNARPYHLHNLLLHLLNLILLFFFVRKFLKHDFSALIVVLLFAVHPLHVEPVVWVTGRKDLLFTLFYLISLLCYIRYLKQPKKSVWVMIAILVAFLALLSKIQALSIPLAWLALDIYYQRKWGVIQLFEKFAVTVLLLYNFFTIPQLIIVFVVLLMLMNFNAILSLQLFKRLGVWLKTRFRTYAFYYWLALMTVLMLLLFRKLNMWNHGLANVQTWLLSAIEVAFLLSGYVLFLAHSGKLGRPLLLQKRSVKYVFLLVMSLGLLFGIYWLLPKMYFWTGDFKLSFSAFDRLLMAAYSLLYYIVHVFVPYNVSPIQPYPADTSPLPLIYSIALACMLILILAGAYLLWRYRRKINREVLFGLSFFFINVVLVLHFISIEGRVIVADRYAYLAIAGLLLAVAVPLERYFYSSTRAIKIAVLVFFGTVTVLFSVVSALQSEHWKNGIVFFTEVIKYNPKYELAYINRGTLYLNSQQNQKAIQDFDKAISLKKNIDFAYYNRALAKYNLGDTEGAYNDCSLTIVSNPEFFDAWYLRAYIKNQRKNYAGALADYNITLQLKSDHKLAWYNRGNTKKNLYNYKGALTDYQRCLELDPEFHMADNAMGVAYFFLGEYAASIPCFDRAIQKKPGEGSYFFNRALSKLKLNATDEACRDLNSSWGLGYSDSKNVIDAHCK